MKVYINEKQVKSLVGYLITEQSTGSFRIFQIPGDNKWTYGLQKGKWYTSRKDIPSGDSKWIRLSDNPKYTAAVEKLDRLFPNARPNVQLGGIPTRNTGPAFNQTPDFETELPTPGFKDPNRFIK